MRKMLLMMVAVLALASAACSSGDDNAGPTGATATTRGTTGTTGTTGATGSTGTTGSTGSTGTESGCSAVTAIDLSGDDPFTVTIRNFAFDPQCFVAASTSTITIVNKDGSPHTFTIDGTQVDVTIDGGKTFNGESAGLAPGTYDFYCKIHPTMTGTVIVV
jgi:plastocyanin